MNFNLNDVKPFLAEMLEKHALDMEKWKEELNKTPTGQRQLNFTFETDKKEKAYLNINFDVTKVEFLLSDNAKEKILGLLASGSMKDL